MTNATQVLDAPTADSIIGRNVDFLIWRARETQTALAKDLEITPGALSHKLNGRRPWTASEIERVARRYRVSIDSLFKPMLEPLPSDYKGVVSDLVKEREKRSLRSVDRPRNRRGKTGPKKRGDLAA